MQHTLADLEFAASMPGIDRRAVRAHLRDADADGLGWVQLVAVGASLIGGALKKKKAKKRARQAEAAAKAAEERERIEAQRQADEVQRAQVLQLQRQQAAMRASSLRAQVAPPAPLQRAVPPQSPARAGSRFPVVPVAIAAGGAIVALALVLRRRR